MGQFSMQIIELGGSVLSAIQQSTLRRLVNRGEHEGVPSELMKWVWAAGRRLPGLVRRRKAEALAYSYWAPVGAEARKDNVEGMQKS